MPLTSLLRWIDWSRSLRWLLRYRRTPSPSCSGRHSNFKWTSVEWREWFETRFIKVLLSNVFRLFRVKLARLKVLLFWKTIYISIFCQTSSILSTYNCHWLYLELGLYLRARDSSFQRNSRFFHCIIMDYRIGKQSEIELNSISDCFVKNAQNQSRIIDLSIANYHACTYYINETY